MHQSLARRLAQELLESASVKEATASSCGEAMVEAVMAMVKTLQSGGKLLLCGNGGSAADCQHLAAEFVAWASDGLRRPGLRAIALTTDTSMLTSVANDFGFERVFQAQVNALGEPGDVLLAISTSGNSQNLLLAAKAAQQRGMKVIGLLGRGGGTLKDRVDIAIIVPSDDVMHIQEAHIAIGHAVCRLVCNLIWPGERGDTAADNTRKGKRCYPQRKKFLGDQGCTLSEQRRTGDGAVPLPWAIDDERMQCG